MSKITILGAGHVGSHCAYALAQPMFCDEIVLVDQDRDKAVAQALDVTDSLSFAPRAAVVRAGDYSDVVDSDIVCCAIGEARKPGQTRLDMMDRSVEMCDELIGQLRPYPIRGILISITNPCDIIADYLRKNLKMDWHRIFGTGTLLDTARLIRALSLRAGVARSSIQAFSMGEHGDSSMIPFSAIRIGGKTFAECGLSREELLEDTRQSGMTIIEGKKSTEFGIGRAFAEMAACILRDEKRVLPASVLLDGQYGQRGLHAGVPCRIGRNGIEEIIELPLDTAEQAQFDKSCEIIRGHIRRAEEIGHPEGRG